LFSPLSLSPSSSSSLKPLSLSSSKTSLSDDSYSILLLYDDLRLLQIAYNLNKDTLHLLFTFSAQIFEAFRSFIHFLHSLNFRYGSQTHHQGTHWSWTRSAQLLQCWSNRRWYVPLASNYNGSKWQPVFRRRLLSCYTFPDRLSIQAPEG